MTQLAPSVIAEAIPQIPFAWLRDRRWFSSKGRQLASLAVIDWGVLPLDAPAIVAFVHARYADDFAETLFLPLVALPDAQIAGARTPAAVAIAQDGSTWYAHDAFQHPSFQRLLMNRLLAAASLPLTHGRIDFAPESALRDSPPPLQEIKLVTAEQSNTSIIYDRQAILKCFRRVVAGVNPDVEISTFLTRAGFRHTPAMLGSISYARDGVEHSLGILQEFVPNRGDAWDHTLDRLNAFLRSIPATTHGDVAAETRRLARESLDEIGALGRLTGELHLALAGDAGNPDFAPRPLTHDQIARWQRSIRESADEILSALAARSGDLPAEQRVAVEGLLASRDRIARRIARLESLAGADLVLTRFHGDYHLGQVLVSERGFLILDFEGEPLRSLAERRAHGSPLKDVAGMLRSLSYAAQAALRAATQSQAARPWIDAWEAAAREAYLAGYRHTTQGAPFVPRADDRFNDALAVFELEKALYELKYELNNRPDWLPIPLAGIRRTL